MNDLPQPPSRSRSRLSLLLIVAVFAVPILAAALLNLGGWMPGHSRNFGEVVNPPLPLREFEFVHATDRRSHLGNTHGQWTLLVRVPDACDAACWERVAILLNVRTSLGRHADKLALVLLDREPTPEQRGRLAGFDYASPTRPLPGRLSAPLAAGPELWLANPHG